MYMYIQNTLHIVQAWIIKYHPNIGSGTVSMLPKSPNSTYISQFLRQAVPVLLRGSAREWQARAPSEERSLFALPLESTTRPKTKTEAQAPARWRIRASTFLKNTWIEARSPTPHPGGDWPLAPGGGGLQIWTTVVAG